MGGVAALTFTIVYIVFFFSIIIFVFMLLIRLVKAHERGADALQTIARNMRSESSRRD